MREREVPQLTNLSTLTLTCGACRQNRARAQEKEAYSQAAEARAQAPPSAVAAAQAPVRLPACPPAIWRPTCSFLPYLRLLGGSAFARIFRRKQRWDSFAARCCLWHCVAGQLSH